MKHEEKNKNKDGTTSKKEKVMIKKSHKFAQNKYLFDLRKGEVLPDGIPSHIIEALKIEQVI